MVAKQEAFIDTLVAAEPSRGLNPTFLEVLRCPYCSGNLNWSGGERVTGELAYGVLSCPCGRAPVVAGIPILKRGAIGAGQTTDKILIDLIEGGFYREALLAALMPLSPDPALLAPPWMKALPSFRGMGRVKGFLGQSGLRRWRDEGERLFDASTNKITIEDLVSFYFRYWPDDSCNYFLFRLGLPRYLVAISLASIVDQPKKPILDLACGIGNMTRYLLRRAKGQLVIGVDQNFFSLYVAKNWLAPGARYVCAMADISLPLANDICSAAFCSDAFHLFLHQTSCIRELKRLTDEDGLIILASVRNALVKKHLYSGSILPSQPPRSYRALVADMPHRLVSDRAILERYLRKQGPPLAVQPEVDDLAGVQWMSVVASRRPEVFHDYGAFEDWPHVEEEHLGLNPLYKEERKDRVGNVLLRRVFPSAWYEQENASDSPQYLPETALISPEGSADLAQEKRTPEMEKLIEQGVVLGIPEVSSRTRLKRLLSVLVFLMLFPGLTQAASPGPQLRYSRAWSSSRVTRIKTDIIGTTARGH